MTRPSRLWLSKLLTGLFGSPVDSVADASAHGLTPDSEGTRPILCAIRPVIGAGARSAERERLRGSEAALLLNNALQRFGPFLKEFVKPKRFSPGFRCAPCLLGPPTKPAVRASVGHASPHLRAQRNTANLLRADRPQQPESSLTAGYISVRLSPSTRQRLRRR